MRERDTFLVFFFLGDEHRAEFPNKRWPLVDEFFRRHVLLTCVCVRVFSVFFLVLTAIRGYMSASAMPLGSVTPMKVQPESFIPGASLVERERSSSHETPKKRRSLPPTTTWELDDEWEWFKLRSRPQQPSEYHPFFLLCLFFLFLPFVFFLDIFNFFLLISFPLVLFEVWIHFALLFRFELTDWRKNPRATISGKQNEENLVTSSLHRRGASNNASVRHRSHNRPSSFFF